MKNKLLILLSIFVIVPAFNAKCNDEFLIAEANALEIDFMWNASGDEQIADKVYLNIDNLDKDLFLVITNETTGERKTIKDSEEDVVTIDVPSPTTQYKYNINIYSQADECPNELLKKVTYYSPIFNKWSLTDDCANLSKLIAEKNKKIEKSADFCADFSQNIYTENEFKKAYNEYLNKLNEPSKKEKLLDKFYKYYYFALIPILLLTIYYIFTLKKIRERKKAQNEE